jgi:hypothetical protein
MVPSVGRGSSPKAIEARNTKAGRAKATVRILGMAGVRVGREDIV